jgi:hypothetical protein
MPSRGFPPHPLSFKTKTLAMAPGICRAHFAEIPAQTLESQFSDRCSPSRNYSMTTWSLFSDGSSLTAAPRSLPDFPSIEAEAGVWLVHNP